MKPKLTLRDLFWLVLVVGLIMGWAVDHHVSHKRYNVIANEYLDYYLEANYALEEARIELPNDSVDKPVIRGLVEPLDRQLEMTPGAHPHFIGGR